MGRRAWSTPLFRGPRGGGNALALKAWRGVKAIKRKQNAEVKKFVLNYSAVQSSTATITAVSLIGQGDDLSQRQGRSVRVVSWRCLADIRGPLGDATDFQQDATVRVALFADNDQAGTIATAAQYHNSTDITSFVKTDLQRRFVNLFDETVITLDNGGSKATPFFRYGRATFAKQGIWGKHMEFIGTGTAQTDMGAGTLYMFTQSSIAAATAGNNPLINYTLEICYVDN